MTRWKLVLGVRRDVVAANRIDAQQGPLRHPPQEYLEGLGPTAVPSAMVAVRAGRLFDSKSGQMLTRQVVLMRATKSPTSARKGGSPFPQAPG
jgi:hypothetical protein